MRSRDPASTSRSAFVLVAAAAAIGLVALLTGGGAGPMGAPPTASASPGPVASRLAWRALLPPVAALPVVAGTPEQRPGAACFGHLVGLDAERGLDGVRRALSMGAATDPFAAAYLKDLVAERVSADAELGLLALALVEAAPDDAVAASVLLGGLGKSAAAADPRIQRALTGLAADTAVASDTRVAALDALRGQAALPTEERAVLAELALEDADDEVNWRATRALGNVMANAHDRDGATRTDWEPTHDQLVTIAETSQDAGVRSLALEAAMFTDPVLSAGAVDRLRDLIATEPVDGVREAALFQLGLTDAPDQALDVMREVFERDTDVCVRWAAVRFSVRAAGPAALPLLDHFASIDPRFEIDAFEFRAIYAAGVRDFADVWQRKGEHHDCNGNHDTHADHADAFGG